MLRVWFNKTFSSVAAAIRLIREADTNGDYFIYSSNTKPLSPLYKVSHDSFIEPAGLKGEDYVEWCLEVCSEKEIKIFIPGKDASTIIGASDRFAAIGTRIMNASTQENIHLIHDKAAFYAHVDLPVTPPAEFIPFQTLEEFDAAYASLKEKHPVLCVKPSVSVYGMGFAVIDEVRNAAQLLLEGVQYHIGLDDFRRGLSSMGETKTMLLMEFLPGHEFSVDCIADHGVLKCAVARKKSMITGQGQTIEVRDDIISTVTKLASDYALNGFFNAQYRESDAGLRLLEINPRMSGGIGMSCLAGPNLPYLALVGFDKGYQSVSIPDIKDGLRVTHVSQAMEL